MSDSDWQTTWHSLHDLLGAKWTGHVLRLLTDGSRGFNEMKAEIDGMTATMLSRRLAELECHGLVDRTVEATTPPRTRYVLTDRGVAFADRLRALEDVVRVADCDSRSDLGAVPDPGCDCAPSTNCRTGPEDACLTAIPRRE